MPEVVIVCGATNCRFRISAQAFAEFGAFGGATAKFASFPMALNMQQNTCPFDVSGHPAVTLPCGKVDGLPIGMMLVGRHFDEAMLVRAAEAFEKATNWKKC